MTTDTRLSVVSRDVFVDFVRERPELTGKPVEGESICAMQYVDAENEVIAQAVYSVAMPHTKVAVTYSIEG